MPLNPGNMPGLKELFMGGYFNLFGPYFWVFLLFLTVGTVYIRTRSFGPTYLVLIVGALVLRVVMPGGVVQGLIFFSVVIGIAYSGYKFFKGRR